MTEEQAALIPEAYKTLKTDENLMPEDVERLRKVAFPDGEEDLDVENANVAKMLIVVQAAATRARANAETAMAANVNEAEEALIASALKYLEENHIPDSNVERPILLEIGASLAQSLTTDITEDEVTIVALDDDINAFVTASGEIVCLIDAPNSDMERRLILEWVGERMTRAQAKQAGIAAEKAAWLKKIDRIYDPQFNKQGRVLKQIEYLYTPVGQAYMDETRAQAVKKIPNSLKVGLLTLAYSTTKARVDITDLVKAIIWCKKNAKDAIQENVLKSLIPDEKKPKLTKEAAEVTGIFAYPGGEKEFKIK